MLVNKTNKKRQTRTWKHIGAAVLSVMLVVALAVGMIPKDVAQVMAESTVDLPTIEKYKDSLGDEASTEYAGRIWTDKSVWDADSVTIEAYGGTQHTITKNDAEKEEDKDEDFLVGFSALATSQEIFGETEAPLDVVFVIDISGSMSNNNSTMDNGYSRIYNTVQALNTAIESLLDLNEYTRVGVVAFSSNAQTVLPLGRYTQYGNNNFFSVNRTAGSSKYAKLTVNANRVGGNRVYDTIDVQGGTNIQRGLYQGFNLLATESEVMATINGQQIQRIPSVVLLSDGAPTFVADTASWWNIGNNVGYHGAGNNAYFGNGMLAMMTGAYMKEAVNRHYKVTDTPYETTLYSIGMGIDDLNANSTREQYQLASITLNPAQNWDNNNTYASSIRGAWDVYVSEQDISVNIGRQDDWGNYHDQIIDIGHPSTYDIIEKDENGKANALKEYVDKYYGANDAESIATVFKDIVSSLSLSRPSAPTRYESSSPLTTGYITYTDPIGEYMEVKDLKSIIYAGEMYTVKSVSKSGSNDDYVETYTFEGEAGNEVYGIHDLSYIIIEVATTVNEVGVKTQTLTTKIPAGLIPIRINTVKLDVDGNVTEHTNNGAYPIRILYTVGLQEVVKGDGYVDTSKLSPEYLADTTKVNEDGSINFFSNLYTGQKVNGLTVGNATARFHAATTNSFYYMQDVKILYKDEECKTPVLTSEELKDDVYYYYNEPYYHGMTKVNKVTSRTGAQFKQNVDLIEVDGAWARPAGSVRTNRMLEFQGVKQYNRTTTATEFYEPTFVQTGETPYDGEFVVYLGNNGKLTAIAGGHLDIKKTVSASEGLTAPDKDFIFTVELRTAANEALTGTYNYNLLDASGKAVLDADGNPVVRTIANGGTITLKAGQTAKILNLPPNSTYTVTETPLSGFTTTVNNENTNTGTGTIVAGETAIEAFNNHYTVSSVTFPEESNLTGKKVLLGRDVNSELDKYTFLLTSYGSAPLPKDYNSETGIIVTLTDNGTKSAEFNFGQVEFTKPGIYRYTIVEKEPETSTDYLPGMTYSRAMYRMEITVTDNGDGTLSTSTDLQKLYEDDATQLFTYGSNGEIVMNPGQEAQDEIIFVNKYAAGAVQRTPVAIKSYTDYSGVKPLRSGMFEFKLEPVGYSYDGGATVEEDSSKVPMPLDEKGGKMTSVTTSNEGPNVTFPSVTFEQKDILQGNSITFVYKFTEVIPEEATRENDYTFKGMTFDPTVVYGYVTISKEANSDILQVSAKYEENDKEVRTAQFTNSYAQTPVTLSQEGGTALKVEKIFTGRTNNAWLTDDSFEFVLEADLRDDATKEAFEADKIVMGGDKEKVSDTITIGNSDEKTKMFNDITFTAEGTYVFKISETAGDIKGVTYDKTVYTVSVIVDDTDDDGVLEADVVYNDGTADRTEDVAVFENTYKAAAADPLTVSGKKEMQGRPLEAGHFYFEVIAQSGPVSGTRAALVGATADLEDKDGNGIYEGTMNLLESVIYDQAGTYVYIVREQIPEGTVNNTLNGVTYDSTLYRITVVVSDDTDGKLVTNTTIDKVKETSEGVYTTVDEDVEIVYKNEYNAAPVSPVIYPAHKVLAGNRAEALKEGEFKFEVSVEGDKTGFTFGDYTEGMTLDNGPKEATNKADGTIVPVNNIPITFIKPGDYSIVMKEIVPVGAIEKDGKYVYEGVTYDTHELRSTFRVSDDGLGKLIVNRIGTTGLTTFTNVYESEVTLDSKGNLQVTKNFTGREGNTWRENVDIFNFELTPYDAVTKAEFGQSITMAEGMNKAQITWVDAEKTAAFGDITFTKQGTYKFMIREVKPAVDATPGAIPGVEYDASPRIVTVSVVDQNDGTMKAEVTGIALEDGTTATLTFNNVFDRTNDPLNGHNNLHVTKVLEGRAWLATDRFTFKILAYNDNAKNSEKVSFEGATEIVATAVNKDVVHFGNILFKAVGEYQFVVIEDVPTDTKGITYDKTARLITVTAAEEEDLTSSLEIKPVTLKARITKVETGTYASGIFTRTGEVEDMSLTFINTYDAEEVALSTKTNLEVTKNLVGRNWRDTDSFVFELTAYNDAAKDNNLVTMPAKDEVTITNKNENYKEVFGDIIFKEAGEYWFMIKEVVPEEDDRVERLAYDEHKEIIIVTVEDNLQGELEIVNVDYSYDNDLTWTNTYTPESVDVTLKAYKTLTGREWIDTDRFEFYISRRVPTNAPIMNSIYAYANGSEVTTGNTKTVEFGAITFTQPGTYTYYINEIGTHAGVTRDTRGLVAVVEITNNEATGKLEAEVNYTFGGAAVEEGEFATFVNTYHTSGTLEGAKNLKVTKDFTGRANNTWRDSDAFSFTLEANGTDTLQAVADGIVTLPANAKGITIAAADKEAGYQKAFGNITFTKPGTYCFAVKEVIPTGAGEENGKTVKDGIAYDTETRIVEVEAKDNADGTMTVTVKGIKLEDDTEGTLAFNNVYTAKEGSLNGTENLMVKKQLEGRDWISGDEFTFTLEAKDEFTTNAVKGGFVVLPTNATGIKITSTDEGYQKAFDDIIFTKIGTYQFVITETDVVNGKGAGNGTIAKNTDPITVIVDVSDNHAGKLVATVTEYSSGSTGLTFRNTFTPKVISVNLEGTKKLLEANDKILELTAGQFDFKVQKPENAPAGTPNVNASGSSASNAADGSVVFENVATFKEAGTFVYDIVEEKGSDAAITYDNTVIKATVKVEYSEETGDLTIANDYPQYSVNNENGFVFTNKYISKPAKFSLNGTKNVTVRAGKYELAANQFEFLITPTAGKANDPITQATIVKNAADATPTDDVHQAAIKLFDNVEYISEGTYVYKITEVDGKYAGFSYDSAIYELTVEVAYNKGQLVATPIITKNQTSTDKIVFNNTYDVHKAGITIGGTKELISDGNKPLESGKYTFKLTPEDAVYPMPVSDTVTNTVDSFNFGEITFTADDVGTYKYKVQEVKGNEPGVTYDDTVYTVTIKVELKEVGGIKNTVVVTKDKEATDIVFTNKYVPKEVVVGPDAAASIGGKKNLEGRELKENEFEFKLVPEKEENPMPNKDTVKNAADKTFVFGDITYTKTGIYKYTIEEINGGLGGVKYDDSVYGVIVEVTDEGYDGQLDAKVTYTLKEKSDVKVEFKNTYTAKAADLFLEGMKKSLKYADLREGAFKFKLTPANPENPMPEKSVVTNGAHGDNTCISFGKMTFTKTGIYEYTLTEVNDGQEYMVYDESEYTIKIEVTDDLKGQLHATVIEPSSEGKLEDIVFNNSFEMPFVEFVKTQTINNGKPVDEKTRVVSGDIITYIMSVTNNGTGNAIGVEVEDKTPEGLIFLKDSVEGGDQFDIAEDGTITWVVDTLKPGETRTMSFKAKVPETNKNMNWSNIASLVYENNPDNPDPTPENPNPEPEPVPSNEVEVDLQAPLPTGDDVNVMVWVLVACAALGLGGAVVVSKKRRTI